MPHARKEVCTQAANGEVCLTTTPYKSTNQLSNIKDWDLLHQRDFGGVFARLLCSAGITNSNEFHTSSSPTLCASNDITSGQAHSICLEIWLL